MKRIAIILIIGWFVVMSAGGMWLACRPPIQASSPSDVTNVHVGVGWWEWTLSYGTPGQLDRWYFPIVYQLESGSWTRSEAAYSGRPQPLVDPVAYVRSSSFGFVVLRERVELDGDLHAGHVQMRRWIAIQ